MTAILSSPIAKSLANHYSPIIYQEYKDIKDMITPFIFGPDKVAMANLPDRIGDPTLYYGVREDNWHYYIYFLVYHAFDWTSSKFLPELDSHRHDTESIIMRVNKASKILDIGTMSHYRILFQAETDKRVTIETETHAIHPFKLRPPSGNFVKYSMFNLINLNDFTEEMWKKLEICLQGNASMPQEQKDSILSSGLQGRKRNKPGDIFLRPDVLFKSAEMKGML